MDTSPNKQEIIDNFTLKLNELYGKLDARERAKAIRKIGFTGRRYRLCLRALEVYDYDSEYDPCGWSGMNEVKVTFKGMKEWLESTH